MLDTSQYAELAACLNVGHISLSRTVKDLSEEQLLKIPAGFKNNILWNIGHVPTIMSALVCKPTETEPVVPKHYHEWFKNGSSPADWTTQPDVKEVLEVFKASTPAIQNALLAGQLEHYQAFDLFPGYTIGSAQHALTFHCFHNGIHVGAVSALKKFV